MKILFRSNAAYQADGFRVKFLLFKFLKNKNGFLTYYLNRCDGEWDAEVNFRVAPE